VAEKDLCVNHPVAAPAVDLGRAPLFIVTMDTDWCPLEVLDYALAEIVDPRLPLTIFSTGTYPSLAVRRRTETALHYNVDNTSFTEAFTRIAAELPGAGGARGHSLAFSERLRALYAPFGISYDSSYMMYRQQHIVPFPIARGVLELPIYFMDLFAMEYEDSDFQRFPHPAELAGPGLKIFDFHPVHLLLNTPSPQYYFEHKQWYHNPQRLLENRYTGHGIRSYFELLQKWIFEHAWPTTTCLALRQAWSPVEAWVPGTSARVPLPVREVRRPPTGLHAPPDERAA
jgi:hypothetical protein